MKRSATNFMKIGLIVVAFSSNAIFVWGLWAKEPAGIIGGIAGIIAVCLGFIILEKHNG